MAGGIADRKVEALLLLLRAGLWEKEPEFDTDQKALPRRLTDVQENGDALQFDSARKRYVKTEEFDTDKMNGYSRFKVFLLRQRTKTR